MYRGLYWTPLVLCGFLSGCVTENSIVRRVDSPAVKIPGEHELDLENPAVVRGQIEVLDRELMKDLLVRTPAGSQVHLIDESDRRYMGTLLNANQEEVDLVNCVCRETVAGPDDQRQCKTSHVPFQSLKMSSLTRLEVIAPPPEDDAGRPLQFDSSDVTVDAIIFKSGRRQRWGLPQHSQPDDANSSEDK